MNELITTNPVEIVTSDECLACGHHLVYTDNFCAHCGSDCRVVMDASISGRHFVHPSSEIATHGMAGTFQKIADNRMIVFAMILFLGPLGFLALWCSRRFSNRAKVIVTASYALLVFVLPVAIIWFWLDVSLRPLVDIFGN